MAYGESIPYPSNPNPTVDFANLDGIDILARLINGEAAGESYTGKIGVAYVIKNRHFENLPEFGGSNEKNIMLHPNQFDGLKSKTLAYQPNINLQSWKDSLFIAQDYFYYGLRYDNPIGNCLWFVGTNYYANHSYTSGGNEYYTGFGTGSSLVTEKVILGGHVFFLVDGY
jgi:hypothetical protein